MPTNLPMRLSQTQVIEKNDEIPAPLVFALLTAGTLFVASLLNEVGTFSRSAAFSDGAPFPICVEMSCAYPLGGE